MRSSRTWLRLKQRSALRGGFGASPGRRPPGAPPPRSATRSPAATPRRTAWARRARQGSAKNSVKKEMRCKLTLTIAATSLVRAMRPVALSSRHEPRSRVIARDSSADGDARKARVLFCLGGPGAGKGTQCAKLEAEFGFVHLSAGDLLRAERASGSADGELIEAYIAEGKIVPVRVTLNLIRKAMQASVAHTFVIDGFPRNSDNLEGWDELMSDVTDVGGVLFYDVSHDVMQERIMKRGETSGRSDDNAEAALKRFRTYEESTRPIIEHFKKRGKLIAVPAAGDVDEVWGLTRAAIEALEVYQE